MDNEILCDQYQSLTTTGPTAPDLFNGAAVTRICPLSGSFRHNEAGNADHHWEKPATITTESPGARSERTLASVEELLPHI